MNVKNVKDELFYLNSLSEEELTSLLIDADRKDEKALFDHKARIVGAYKNSADVLEILILGSEGCRLGTWRGKVGGVWLRTQQTDIILDPGPSSVSIVSDLIMSGQDFFPERLNAIFCSHVHPDHIGNLPNFIEGMTCGMTIKNGFLISNRTVVEDLMNFDPWYLSYVKPVILSPDPDFHFASALTNCISSSDFQLNDLLVHAVPTKHVEKHSTGDSGIGLFIQHPLGTIWYTSDTVLEDRVIDYIQALLGKNNLFLVIANADASKLLSKREVESSHLVTSDVITIAKKLAPRFVAIHHYDEAYAQRDYKIAQAVFLNRKLVQLGMLTRAIPTENGLSLKIGPKGKINVKNYFNDRMSSRVISEYCSMVLK